MSDLTFNDKVLIKTIREWVTFTGYEDEDIIVLSVKDITSKLSEAGHDTLHYWNIFLQNLYRNLIYDFCELLTREKINFTKVEIMSWPEGLRNPDSPEAESSLDILADQIKIVFY